ncbi:hypothetical protein DNK06_03850 [Pseudomonas daroniae]|uniref:Uncharacterized protein n=1 Tax=Phytopseudomonas daroniae TaxID=2487519 RepID=A0A4Q9QPU6_9GAMM|nr:hypothetical protein DNK06_03850 [Pseudomonas daroniae]
MATGAVIARASSGWRVLRACSRSRELEQCKAKTGEEAEFTAVNEHSEPVFNAAGPKRSRHWTGSQAPLA